MPVSTLPERAVMEIWRQHVTGRTDLETEDGQPVSVVYPGMISSDRGADFVDAVIDNGRGRLRGNIEIHVNSSGWWGHGHHRDPAYNGVILHVVYHRDRAKAVCLQNGTSIPTLVLDKYIAAPSGRGVCLDNPALPCGDIIHRRGESFLREILESAGEERFSNKVTCFKEEIYRVGAEQALYAAIMESLGYARNKKQMKKLAGLLPLSTLEKLVDEYSAEEDGPGRLQALFSGTAGLLSSQRNGTFPDLKPAGSRHEKLERYWQSSGEKPGMNREEWEFFKVRPGNYPTTRLAAMSILLYRYRETGLLEGLLEEIIRKEQPDYNRLVEALYVPTEGTGIKTPALLGRGRAADIIVNVVLPLAAAQGEITPEPELNRRAYEIYRRYPRLDTNNLEKHMSNQFGIDRGKVITACQQQGLIHVYRRLCSRGKCPECPLNLRKKPSRRL